MTPLPETRLIVIRGNSASGKSTLARAVRAARPRGVAIVGQDQLRRELLHVRDSPGNPSVDLIDLCTRFALDRGLDVVLEGILYAPTYGPMLRQLIADHPGVTRCYRYDLPYVETVRRHRMKPQSGEYGEPQLRAWWCEVDPVPGLHERRLCATLSVDDAVRLILTDCGWPTGAET